MKKKSAFIVIPLCILLFYLKPEKNSGLDSVEDSIVLKDEIAYSNSIGNISISVKKIRAEVDELINGFNFPKTSNPEKVYNSYSKFVDKADTSEPYLHVLAREIQYHRYKVFNTKARDTLVNSFKYAKFCYDGYIDGKQLTIYADANKQVTSIQLKADDTHYHSMHESFLFVQGEITTISRDYMVLKSVGANGENREYDYEQEILKFAQNSLFEVVTNRRGNVEKSTDISDKTAKRYLRTALLFKKIAESVIANPNVNCITEKAYFEDGSDKAIAHHLDLNFVTDSFFTVNNEKYLYRERVSLSINENGNVDEVLINPFSGVGFQGNKDFYERVTKEIKRILKQTTWHPERKNCRPVKSVKDLYVHYNDIVEHNKLNVKSDRKGRFLVQQAN